MKKSPLFLLLIVILVALAGFFIYQNYYSTTPVSAPLSSVFHQVSQQISGQAPLPKPSEQVAAVVSTGPTFYVDGGGHGVTCSDSYNRSTNNLSHPYCTVQRAADLAVAGDNI